MHIQSSNHSNGNSKYIFERYSKEIWNIQMQFLEMDSKYSNANLKPFERDLKHSTSYSKGFSPFECKFQLFERDSKCLNANSSHSKEIWSIWIQILRDSKHSNANSNHSNQIPSFERKFELFERESKHLNANANHSNKTQSIWMQIVSIRIKFKAFECNHSKGIRMQIRTIPTKFHHSNANSNYLNMNRNIWMQMLTIRTKLKAFECKF